MLRRLCLPVFVTMGLSSVTRESVKVSSELLLELNHRPAHERHESKLLILQLSSASGPSGRPAPPAGPPPPCSTALYLWSLPSEAHWSQFRDVSGPASTWILVCRCLESRETSVQVHWWRTSCVQMLTSVEVMLLVGCTCHHIYLSGVMLQFHSFY